MGMNRPTAILMLFMLVALLHPVRGEEVAIIVNKSNSIDEISLKELKNIFDMNQQNWEGRQRIYLVLLKSGESENDVMLKKVYQRTHTGQVKYWKKIQFNGIGKIPKKWNSASEAKQVVQKLDKAIGYINVGEVDDSIKVLRVDGLLPGEKGYPLSSNEP